MDYKVVPAPIAIQTDAKGAAEKAAKAYEAIIAREAVAGWRFHSFDSTTVKQVACCDNQTFTIKILVFVKD